MDKLTDNPGKKYTIFRISFQLKICYCIFVRTKCNYCVFLQHRDGIFYDLSENLYVHILTTGGTYDLEHGFRPGVSFCVERHAGIQYNPEGSSLKEEPGFQLPGYLYRSGGHS